MLGGVRGDWKEWVAMGMEIFIYSLRCVACRTICLPSFNRFCCKLTEIALFIAELWEPHTHIHVRKICKGLKITANDSKK